MVGDIPSGWKRYPEMAKGPTCLMCGTAHFSTQRCPAAEEAPNRLHIEGTVVARGPRQIEAPRKQLALPPPERKVEAKKAAEVEHKRPDGRGVAIMVKVQPPLLEKIDRFRETEGGITRPEALRRIAEEKLE